MKENANDLLHSISVRLDRESFLANQAAGIGFDLFLAKFVYEIPDALTRDIFLKFWERINRSKIENILVNQINYALRLAAPGQLEYEEVNKIFSLCDDVYALAILGFKAPEELIAEFEDKVREKLASVKKISRAVANASVEDWNRNLWWYKENVSK
ncbi:hypothetical protein [Massilia sp. CCM 8734]|uniref:hypothetical protein n=1 Tax=Massilia sp. CCM 8734 TaxID=2609283 RepID=UPI0014249F69|nr:hypothetical protein [Massilia sp. CCM 8734]NHZ99182.1 hypothetical protein [Massilia sp. CCM 8734]